MMQWEPTYPAPPVTENAKMRITLIQVEREPSKRLPNPYCAIFNPENKS
jgi:hypothetical protein